MAKETFTRIKPHLEPPPASTSNFSTGSAEADSGILDSLIFTFTGGDQAGFVFICYMSAPVTPGKMTISDSKLRRFAVVANTGLSGILDLHSAAIDFNPNVSSGSKIFVRIDAVHTLSGSRTRLIRQGLIVSEIV